MSNLFVKFVTILFLLFGFEQGCAGKWIIKQKVEHTVIVLKNIFYASPALATVTHPVLFLCEVP